MSSGELLSVGEIAGVFGVKGWVKVYSYTDPKQNILNYSPWTLKNGDQLKKVEVLDGKQQGKGIVAHLEDIDDRDIAASFCSWEILIYESQLPKPEEGEYYWSDLIGLEVITDKDVNLGTVDTLIETGANDVLVIKDHDQERLIPFLLGQTIKKIDLQGKQMVVDWDPDF